MRITVPFLSAVGGIFLTTRGRKYRYDVVHRGRETHREAWRAWHETADVVIIGGGIIGASIAYHLRQDGLSGRLLVIERDTTYSRATTPMSMGGVRQQYGVPCNIALARYSLQFYEQFDELMVGAWGRPQAHFHQCGYLFLFNETQRPAIMQKYEIQRQMGVEVELLSPQQVLEIFPHLGLDDIDRGHLRTP